MNWRRTQDKRGYVVMRKTENGRHVRISEHKAVWQQHFGSIPPGYFVHHIDGDCSNNAICNLQCMSAHDHKLLHMRGTVAVPVCPQCKRPADLMVKGVCRICYNTERYWRLHSHQHPRAVRYDGVLCTHCSKRPAHAKGLCHSCYQVAWKRAKREAQKAA